MMLSANHISMITVVFKHTTKLAVAHTDSAQRCVLLQHYRAGLL
jgi:hypothetical protein